MAASLRVRGGAKYTQTTFAKVVAISSNNVLLHDIIVANKSVAAFFVQVFNAATASGDPVIEFEVAAGTTGAVSFDVPLRLPAGAYARAVTALGGSTAISGDDAKFTVHYEIGPVSA